MIGWRNLLEFGRCLAVCSGDPDGCHSERPFASAHPESFDKAQDKLCEAKSKDAQGKLRDEESQAGRDNTRFLASIAFRLGMTPPHLPMGEVLRRGIAFFFLLQGLMLCAALSSFGGEITGQVLRKDGASVAQAIVFVQSLPEGVAAPKGPWKAEMDQLRREFVPSVLPITIGTEVRFPNRDQIHHHVYSFSRTKSFELPLYKDEEAAPVLFDKPGVVKIGCNIHDWMSATIFVAPTPYFALSDGIGKFHLKDLPAGSYSLAAWHESSLSKVEDTLQSVQVSEQTPEVSFTLEIAPPRARPGSRKEGGY